MSSRGLVTGHAYVVATTGNGIWSRDDNGLSLRISGKFGHWACRVPSICKYVSLIPTYVDRYLMSPLRSLRDMFRFRWNASTIIVNSTFENVAGLCKTWMEQRHSSDATDIVFFGGKGPVKLLTKNTIRPIWQLCILRGIQLEAVRLGLPRRRKVLGKRTALFTNFLCPAMKPSSTRSLLRILETLLHLWRQCLMETGRLFTTGPM